MRSVFMSILATGCSLILAASSLAQMQEPNRQNQKNLNQAQEQQAQEQQVQGWQYGQDQYVQHLMEPDQLKGMRVHDAQGDEIGSVDKVVLDAMSGRIGYIVVASGGFLGLRSEESIIPWSAVQFHPLSQQQQEEPFLMVNMPKGRLLAAPHGDVQDIDRKYAELIHEYYGVAPYWQDTQAPQEQADPQRQQQMPVQQQPLAPAQEPQ
jgi:sporulation protein YlmC with PRC-barrel domain